MLVGCSRHAEKAVSSRPLLVLTTCANADEASRLAAALVEQRLAACVNAVSNVTSTYRWQGRSSAGTGEPVVDQDHRGAVRRARAGDSRSVELRAAGSACDSRARRIGSAISVGSGPPSQKARSEHDCPRDPGSHAALHRGDRRRRVRSRPLKTTTCCRRSKCFLIRRARTRSACT